MTIVMSGDEKYQNTNVVIPIISKIFLGNTKNCQIFPLDQYLPLIQGIPSTSLSEQS